MPPILLEVVEVLVVVAGFVVVVFTVEDFVAVVFVVPLDAKGTFLTPPLYEDLP